MPPFLLDEDFDCFDVRYARVEEGPVIAARQKVRRKLRRVHNESLGGFMAAAGLHAHWDRDYLTNVYFPQEKANGGWVDYMRMGYGEERRLVQLMAERGAFNTELTTFGQRDMLAFFMTAQVQVGINYDNWWINFYMNDKGWLEQKNLVHKAQHPRYRDQLTGQLDALQDQGYELTLYKGYGTEEPRRHLTNRDEFLDDLQDFHDRKQMVHISVELALDRDGPENDADTWPQFVVTEMERLLPLYRFVSWHPERNHYIPAL